jgi:hypothetical protein
MKNIRYENRTQRGYRILKSTMPKISSIFENKIPERVVDKRMMNMCSRRENRRCKCS